MLPGTLTRSCRHRSPVLLSPKAPGHFGKEKGVGMATWGRSVETDYRPAALNPHRLPSVSCPDLETPTLVTPTDLPARLCSCFPHTPAA